MFKHKDKDKHKDKNNKENDKEKESKRKSHDKSKTIKEERRSSSSSSKKPRVPDTPKPHPPSEKKRKTLVRAASDANIGKIQPKKETASEPLFQKFPAKPQETKPNRPQMQRARSVLGLPRYSPSEDDIRTETFGLDKEIYQKVFFSFLFFLVLFSLNFLVFHSPFKHFHFFFPSFLAFFFYLFLFFSSFLFSRFLLFFSCFFSIFFLCYFFLSLLIRFL